MDARTILPCFASWRRVRIPQTVFEYFLSDLNTKRKRRTVMEGTKGISLRGEGMQRVRNVTLAWARSMVLGLVGRHPH